MTTANTSNQHTWILNYTASNISSGWREPEAKQLAVHLSPTKCSVELHFYWSSHPQTPIWSLFQLLICLCGFFFPLSWKIHRDKYSWLLWILTSSAKEHQCFTLMLFYIHMLESILNEPNASIIELKQSLTALWAGVNATNSTVCFLN